MPEQSVIVWDLETIPDLEAAARMLDMGHASDAESAKHLARVSRNTRSIRLCASAPWSRLANLKAGA